MFIIRKITGIKARLIYSQTGEDATLEYMLSSKKNILYVDVGCNDPIKYSNSLKFYIDGHRGICIDANEELIIKYRRYRPKDIAVHSAVSNKIEKKIFHISEENLVSTLDQSTFKEWSKKWSYNDSKEITTQTLNKILDDHLPNNQTIGFLSIDVEGYDFKVLKSINLNTYRPTIILIETHSFNISSISLETNEIFIYLKENDYELKFFSTRNSYFVDLRSKEIIGN